MQLHDFALVASAGDIRHAKAFRAFRDCLQKVGVASQHPELVNAPYVTVGFSADGGFASTLITFDPDRTITAGIIEARLRATNLKVGKEGWHDARVAMSFEGGSFGYPPEVPELRADADWVTKSVELKVPKGAIRLNIQPAMFYCTGVFEIADLTVTPRLAGGECDDPTKCRRNRHRRHRVSSHSSARSAHCQLQPGGVPPGRSVVLERDTGDAVRGLRIAHLPALR